jgi:hypothetical protein
MSRFAQIAREQVDMTIDQRFAELMRGVPLFGSVSHNLVMHRARNPSPGPRWVAHDGHERDCPICKKEKIT